MRRFRRALRGLRRRARGRELAALLVAALVGATLLCVASSSAALFASPLARTRAVSLFGNAEISTAARLRRDGIREVDGLLALVRRRAPARDVDLVRFVLEKEDAADAAGDDNDWYEFRQKSTGSIIMIHGTSLSALSFALGDLYRRDCGVELLSWASRGESFPADYQCLRALRARRGRFRARVPWRYYLNQVTYSYSMSTWGWRRWEEELDWMALHGVNLALAHLGQEALWARVYTSLLGPDQTFDRQAFFTGAAYYSWQRMGNVQGIGAPVTDALLAAQLELQHRILGRMGSLGIAPVLPAFNLYVPEQVARMSASSEEGSLWSGFRSRQYSGLHRLLADDPLVAEISARFIEAQRAEYAAEFARAPVHFYSCDLYNEMSSGDTDSVRKAFRSVFAPVHEADASAHFVVQMWFLAHGAGEWPLSKAKAFLDAVPRDRILYLDLHGEKRPQWERLAPVLDDARLVWTYLHNFGGSKGIGGEMRLVKEAISEAVRYGKVRGIGLAMEGIEQNEIAYHQVLDLAWEHADMEAVEDWVRMWAAARYRLGSSATRARELATEAWVCAFQTAYSRPRTIVGWGNTKCVLELRPGLNLRHRSFQPTDIAYPPAKFRACTATLAQAEVQALPAAAARSVLRYDLVDFGRQAICDKALSITTQMSRLHRHGFYKEADFANFETLARWMTVLLRRVITLLESHVMWAQIADSVDEALAGPAQLADLRELFTRWSRHTAMLDGYASRLTGDLARHVYLPRWRVFLDALLLGEDGFQTGVQARLAKVVEDFVRFSPPSGAADDGVGDDAAGPINVATLLQEIEAMDAAMLVRRRQP